MNDNRSNYARYKRRKDEYFDVVLSQTGQRLYIKQRLERAAELEAHGE